MAALEPTHMRALAGEGRMTPHRARRPTKTPATHTRGADEARGADIIIISG